MLHFCSVALWSQILLSQKWHCFPWRLCDVPNLIHHDSISIMFVDRTSPNPEWPRSFPLAFCCPRFWLLSLNAKGLMSLSDILVYWKGATHLYINVGWAMTLSVRGCDINLTCFPSYTHMKVRLCSMYNVRTSTYSTSEEYKRLPNLAHFRNVP